MDGLKKRKVQNSTKSQSSKKRKTNSAAKKPLSKGKRSSVAADSLRWREAKLPDMLNDAEGFFGLEEIDDVDVVRTAGNRVEFFTRSEQVAADDAANESDEFEGFDDEPAEQTTTEEETTEDKPTEKKPAETTPNEQASTEKQPAQEKPNQKQKKEPKKKAKKDAKPAADDDLQSNVFAALEGAGNTDEDVDMSAWARLGLSPQLLSSLAQLKFTEPTLIQKKAVPQIIEGHDVIGKASTGSGKTLAFALPIVEKWLDTVESSVSQSKTKTPLALILSPTRELAHQITDHIKALCAGLSSSPYVCTVTGGLAVQKQQRQLSKADIVIGTPGRLWEVLSDSFDLMRAFRGVNYLVIDEADRLLTEGHFKEATEIFGALDRVDLEEDEEESESAGPAPRQTLVFSATFHQGLQQKLAGKGRFDLMSKEDSMEYLMKKLNFREEQPKFIDTNPVSQMADRLKEGLVQCGPMEKDLYLYAVLLLYPNARTLVFTNAISSVRRVAPMLNNLNLTTHPLHSEMHQKARLRAVEQFTKAPKNKSSILVATDVAARGLDIPEVDLILHYHVPRTADTYVHRSGRTARADKTGLSVLLCSPEEVTPTSRLLAKVHANRGRGTKNAFVRTLDMDRKLVGRLKPRLNLSKEIADAILAKEKGHKEEEWMRKAADELGVDYDSDEFQQIGKWGGRGKARKEKQDEAKGITKAELGAKKAALRDLLSQRINAGVSEKYIASGGMNIGELLSGAKTEFLGKVPTLEQLFDS